MVSPALVLVEENHRGEGQKSSSGFEDRMEEILKLPELQRARIAQFCYARVHMREMGLRIANTCELPMLKIAFGAGAHVVFEQSRDVEKTLESLNRHDANRGPKAVTLA